ncbi:MAG: TonB-dependent receptor [Verrucomicrobiae bacterium]|nr:TonB-dependent receptor [Verrucomicrobiae bacterium]
MKNRLFKILATGAGVLGAPAWASAHELCNGASGWSAGFQHPWSGWDHLLVMLAVGVWAARMDARTRWRLPLAFVSAMVLGGLLGAAGVRVPGVEFLVLLSVPVFGVLILDRARIHPAHAAGLTAVCGLFHGLAHGAEVPVSASAGSFVAGFAVATLLLQGLGLLAARVATAVFALAVSQPKAAAQSAGSAPSGVSTSAPPATLLGTVTVEGRADSLVGIADSATEGTVGAKQLAQRPILRAGEILETVPGVIITQHAGGGKANQYFLRGFNLDHGTDFAVFLDGMPLNLPTHGHGQGYLDLNILIPELVQRVNYQKGVYYAENGDFSSAGAARIESFKVLPETLLRAEAGMYGYGRGVFGVSPELGAGHLLCAGEVYHHDGPWEKPDDYWRFNGVLGYSQGDDANNFSVTLRGYHGDWNSSDQVAASAVREGLVPFFGSLNDTTGGESQRYSLGAEWNRAGPDSITKVVAYGFFYDLDLFSDFTYFLVDTHRGDQFEQADRRWVAGLDARHTLLHEWAGRDLHNTFGLQVRNDWIRNGLFQTQNRRRVDKVDAATGNVIPARTRRDEITQTSVGLFYENKVQWVEKFRTVAGVRGDFFNFDVDSIRPENSGSRSDAIASPKLSLIFGPWAKTEFYLQGGLGFHSNDGRGVNTRTDPISGEPVERADPLVRTWGAEIGARTTFLPGLQSTLSVWWLDVDSELVFVGDAGTTEASRPSRRYGVEWANFYAISRHWTLDADFSFSHAEFRDDAPEGDHIPGAIESVIAAGIAYQADNGFFASLRLRYFGPRPLIEDNSVRSSATVLLNAQLGWRINKTWTVSAEILNLLDRRDQDIAYFYESRVRPGDPAFEQIHFHPVEPIQARVAITGRF